MAHSPVVRLKGVDMPKRKLVTTPPPELSLEPLNGVLQQVLQEPHSIEATHIPQEFISNLALKIN